MAPYAFPPGAIANDPAPRRMSGGACNRTAAAHAARQEAGMDLSSPFWSRGLPDFADIRPGEVEAVMDGLLESNRQQLGALLQSPQIRSWGGLARVEALHERLHRTWALVQHLRAVADSKDLRQAYDACLPKLSAYEMAVGQNEELHRAYQAVREGPEYGRLSPARQRVVENALRDFRLAGIHLSKDGRRRLQTIHRRLGQLEAQFEENLLDAANAWHLRITDERKLRGLPALTKKHALRAAREKGLPGWLLTLDDPCCLSVLRYADDRDLRESLYRAHATRASDQGPGARRWDNSGVMEEILRLRGDKASLLGFPSYAHYSMERKMAKNPEEILRFLGKLATCARPAAVGELRELRSFAKARFGLGTLAAWDIPYYSEKLRHHRYRFSGERLRSYFAVPQVLKGMFRIARRLFGIEVLEAEKFPPAWHPSVRLYRVADEKGREYGCFYLDLYTRPRKQGGAWMEHLRNRQRVAGELERPVACLTTNFAPPLKGRPGLLAHDEVETLFHEFGHVLHHLLTEVEESGVSGIDSVPWDAVELPSQLLENWCWERDALALFGRHYRTGKPIGEGLLRRILAARNFQAGMQTVRQVELGLFDLRLHLRQGNLDNEEIQSLLDKVRKQTAVVFPPPYNRFQHGFSHIFAGGYAAGYYGYQWAETMAADAFSRFAAEGLFDRRVGEEFLRAVLARGGAEEPRELFVRFRNREPSIQPLLDRIGLAGEA